MNEENLFLLHHLSITRLEGKDDVQEEEAKLAYFSERSCEAEATVFAQKKIYSN